MNSYRVAYASAQKLLTKQWQTQLAIIITFLSHTWHITSSSFQLMLKISSCSTNASGRRWHHLPTARSVTAWLKQPTRCWCIISVCRLEFWDKDEVTDFQWFCGLSNFPSWRMHCPVWIHCCQWSKYDFCISQGSVATTLRRGGQNYRHLHQISF